MRKPGGYLIITEPDAKPTERDTLTCAHCGRVVIVEPAPKTMGVGEGARELAGMAQPDPIDAGFCMRCMDHICGPCADAGVCAPLLKQIEESERRGRERSRLLDAVAGG